LPCELIARVEIAVVESQGDAPRYKRTAMKAACAVEVS